MTPAEELAKLEAVYSKWIDAGMPAEWEEAGQKFVVAQMTAITSRIDKLRAITGQAGTTPFRVAGYRNRHRI